MVKMKSIVLAWAAFTLLLFASGALAQDKKYNDELLDRFFSDDKTEMEKSADDPGRMEAYALVQKDINRRDRNGKTLLHHAANKGYLSVVQLLVKKGADVNVRDNDKRTPLHEAVSYFAYDVAEFLIKNGADMTAGDKDGATPLFAIAFSDYGQKVVELLHFFIENGFDVAKSADKSLLDESIARGHRDVALILLEKGAAFGEGSLLAAARKGYEDIFMILLAKGAKPNRQDILSAACESGNVAIVGTLVEKGEAPTAEDVSLALFYGHKQVAAYLNEELKKAGKQIVDLRSRCNLKPTSGRCMANFTRGYFEPLTSSCRQFSYGGCGGEVPFYSLDACRNVCEDVPGKKGAPANNGDR